MPNQPIQPLLIKQIVEYMENGGASVISKLNYVEGNGLDLINYLLVYEMTWIDANNVEFNFDKNKDFNDLTF